MISIIYQIIPCNGVVSIHFFLQEICLLIFWISILMKNHCKKHWFSLRFFFSEMSPHWIRVPTYLCAGCEYSIHTYWVYPTKAISMFPWRNDSNNCHYSPSLIDSINSIQQAFLECLMQMCHDLTPNLLLLCVPPFPFGLTPLLFFNILNISLPQGLDFAALSTKISSSLFCRFPQVSSSKIKSLPLTTLSPSPLHLEYRWAHDRPSVSVSWMGSAVLCSVQFNCSVMSNSLWPHGLQHTRLPSPAPSPGACSNSCPSSRWWHPTVSSSVVPFCFCLQSFPASGSFLMGQFFSSGGWSIGALVSASVLPMNIQGLSIQDWPVWSPCSPRESPTPQLKSINSLVLSFLYGPTLTSIHYYWKNHDFD